MHQHYHLAPQHTLGHVNCPPCTEALREAMGSNEFAVAPFSEAAQVWLSNKQIYVGPRTLKDYRQYIKSLQTFFHGIPLNQIHVGNIREYQKLRRTQDVGATRINHELGALAQILKEAKLWHRVGPYYKPLPVDPQGPGQALTREQAKKLFDAGRKNARWEVALYCAILSANTTAGPGEIRHLQLRDIDLSGREITIRRGVKNRFRIRVIPLNDAAFAAVKVLLERANEKGSHLPVHHLLPHRAQNGKSGADPTRPQSHWYKAWRAMCRAAGVTIRPYDLRHTAITWLFSSPSVPERVVVEMAGWVDPRMAARYSHIRQAAKRAAVKAIEEVEPKPKPPASEAPPSSTLSILWKAWK